MFAVTSNKRQLNGLAGREVVLLCRAGQQTDVFAVYYQGGDVMPPRRGARCDKTRRPARVSLHVRGKVDERDQKHHVPGPKLLQAGAVSTRARGIKGVSIPHAKLPQGLGKGKGNYKHLEDEAAKPA